VTELRCRRQGFDYRHGLLFFYPPQRLEWVVGQPRLLSNDAGSFFPGCMAAGPWSWPLISSSAEVKISWSYTSTPPYVFMAWHFVKYRDYLKEADVAFISESKPLDDKQVERFHRRNIASPGCCVLVYQVSQHGFKSLVSALVHQNCLLLIKSLAWHSPLCESFTELSLVIPSFRTSLCGLWRI